jgi:hypothetical protein
MLNDVKPSQTNQRDRKSGRHEVSLPGKCCHYAVTHLHFAQHDLLPLSYICILVLPRSGLTKRNTGVSKTKEFSEGRGSVIDASIDQESPTREQKVSPDLGLRLPSTPTRMRWEQQGGGCGYCSLTSEESEGAPRAFASGPPVAGRCLFPLTSSFLCGEEVEVAKKRSDRGREKKRGHQVGGVSSAATRGPVLRQQHGTMLHWSPTDRASEEPGLV